LELFNKILFLYLLILKRTIYYFYISRFKNINMASRPAAANRRNSVTVHPYPNPSMVSIVLGAQWGDEVSK
jgi:hypothetical protein